MKLEDLTWQDIREYLTSNRHLILPIGTCEQHGTHLPLNCDTLVANDIAEVLSVETGILVGPALNYGVNLPCDSRYSGTCSTTKALLSQFLNSILKWWKRQGFKRFFLLSAHGDPFHIDALKAADPDSVRVLELYDYHMADILQKQQSAKHACEAETSIMLFLWPDKVRENKIQDFQTPFEKFMPYLRHEKRAAIQGSPGVQGYPSYATAEKGKVLLLGTLVHPDTVFKTIIPDVQWFGIIRPIIGKEDLDKLIKFVDERKGFERGNRYLLSKQAKDEIAKFQEEELHSLSWPEKLTAIYTISIYKQQKERGTLNNFYQEYMNMFQDPDDRKISRESFIQTPFKIFDNYGVQYIEFKHEDRLWSGPVNLRIGLDIASSESKKSDDTIISVVGLCRVWPKVAGIDWKTTESSLRDGRVFPVIIHIEGGKYAIENYEHMPGMSEAMERLCNKYKIERIVAESNGQQLQIVRGIRKYFTTHGRRESIEEKFNQVKKSERILSVLEALAHRYKYFICTEDRIIDKMITQLEILGIGDHDDYIDSPSLGFENMLPPRPELKTDRDDRNTGRMSRGAKARKLFGKKAWYYT